MRWFGDLLSVSHVGRVTRNAARAYDTGAEGLRIKSSSMSIVQGSELTRTGPRGVVTAIAHKLLKRCSIASDH